MEPPGGGPADLLREILGERRDGARVALGCGGALLSITGGMGRAFFSTAAFCPVSAVHWHRPLPESHSPSPAAPSISNYLLICFLSYLSLGCSRSSLHTSQRRLCVE